MRGCHPGLLSGIALSGANARDSKEVDDGILTAVEVAELDLERAELVVLSEPPRNGTQMLKGRQQQKVQQGSAHHPRRHHVAKHLIA